MRNFLTDMCCAFTCMFILLAMLLTALSIMWPHETGVFLERALFGPGNAPVEVIPCLRYN